MTENKKVLKVLQGFLELSDTEKQILINEVSSYMGKSMFGRDDLKRELRVKLSSNLGPTNDNSCPCCGKG